MILTWCLVRTPGVSKAGAFVSNDGALRIATLSAVSLRVNV